MTKITTNTPLQGTKINCRCYWKSCIAFAPCKEIRIPESRKFLLVESGILGFGIQNPALGIRNPTKDWNPESTLLRIHSRFDWVTHSKEKNIYGKPPQGIYLNVTTWSVLLYRYWWNTFIARSEDTIFIFHVWGYWCRHGY